MTKFMFATLVLIATSALAASESETHEQRERFAAAKACASQPTAEAYKQCVYNIRAGQ